MPLIATTIFLCTSDTAPSEPLDPVVPLDLSTSLYTRDTAPSEPLDPWVVPLDDSLTSLCTEDTAPSEPLSRDDDCLIISVKDVPSNTTAAFLCTLSGAG